MLLSISRDYFVKEAPILFLHRTQDGCWFKVGDQQDVASRFQPPEEFIDGPSGTSLRWSNSIPLNVK